MSNRTRFADRHIDKITRALRTIDEAHGHVHEGERFVLTDISTVGDGGSRELFIQTPSGGTYAHMVVEVISIFETTFQMFETTTKGYVHGNNLNGVNRDRNSSTTSILTLCHTPSGAGNGTLLVTEHWGTDSTGNSGKGGIGGTTSSNGRNEFILKSNEKYLIKVISGTAANKINIVFDWYEHESFTEY